MGDDFTYEIPVRLPCPKSSVRRFDPSRFGRSLVGRRRNLAYIALWAIVFATMSAVQGVGDKHPGQFVPFWQDACKQQRAHACPYLTGMLENFCRQDSGWACNELGVFESERDRIAAMAWFERACDLQFAPACNNARRLLTGSGAAETAPPALLDYPIILRGSKAPITGRTPSELYALACSEGWPDTCVNTAVLSSK